MAIQKTGGTTFALGTQGWSADIDNISQSGEEVDDIQTTHFGTTNGYHTYEAADFKEGGTYTLQGNYTGVHVPSIGAANETMTLDPGGSGKTSAFPGYVKSFARSEAAINGKWRYTMVIKVAGKPTNTTS